MNEAVALAPNDIDSNGLGQLRALAGLASQRRSAVSPSADQIIGLGSLGSLIDKLLIRTVREQSVEEFRATRSAVIGTYTRAVIAFAQLIEKVVPAPTIDRVIAESFSEQEKEFRDHGEERFGTTVKDQAIFTIWTLRKTSGVITKVASRDLLSPDLRQKDRELARTFSGATAWTQFHLDCLLTSIRHDIVILPVVLPEIVDGLRAAVNAYGHAREGLDLRVTTVEPEVVQYQWDEEDQMLLDSSMREMELQVPELAWSENDAMSREQARELKASSECSSAQHVPAFGTHVREGVNIIKDWITNPNPKE